MNRKVFWSVPNKELESFAFAVSHDLRVPLRHVYGFAGMFAEEYSAKLGEEGRDLIRCVKAGAARMMDLINVLLDLSRLSRIELNRSTVYLSTLAKATAADLQRTQPERRVEFVIAEDMTVEGDRIMLQALIDNLMSNAWEYTSKRPVARIECGIAQLDGDDVYFVRDNGSGFDMQYKNKFFKPFSGSMAKKNFPGLALD